MLALPALLLPLLALAQATPAELSKTPRRALSTETPQTSPRNTLQSATSADTRAVAPQLGQLLAMDDQATIELDGQRISVGTLRNEISTQLARSSGSPRQALRKVAPPRQGVGALSSGLQDRQVAINQRPDCNTSPPTITRVRGHATPGNPFRVSGYCFGSAPGRIEFIGNLPRDLQRASFTTWSDASVDVVMPPVRGATDGQLAVTLVTADGRRSAAQPVQFVASRETFRIPAAKIRPSARVIEPVRQTADNVFARIEDTRLQVLVSPQCSVDHVFSSSRIGAVTAIGFLDDGAVPSRAEVGLSWRRGCTHKVENRYLIASTSVAYCAVDIQVEAEASCPSGFTP